ncbi:hypothetical protein POSPLADRAFT_1128861 [Postia placenta MAD-698-R-SB12]|uniref:UvrD-like helicase ATP-binding domain-containing protein n=1 Tax=Postia placenta MAD-698-R-SB12 TaxID=670580 RepID=A0A1X6NHK8_9APHY|nr:hypothetical protein POSPLADRAFT_1128861 [Postia placenta MAD-698-R-SB12]OSX68101.1 hypothetical protein POSPLADRAFT_1128861 [Postia placenta MAD-698-R-SB12]
MKAALYFDSAEGFGQWRVLISTRADSHLRQARKKNRNLFDIIIKKIKELSSGHFSEDNQKLLTGTETDVPIYEAKMTRDSRLVYQIDCVPEFESNVSILIVIKLFGIYTHAQLDQRFWDGVGYQLGRKGKEYRKRCTFRNRPSKVGVHAGVILPAEFPPPQEATLESPSLEKYVTFSQVPSFVTFVASTLTGDDRILADADVAHVFDVSPLEKVIIEHQHSCYVLGRSGTGKTTTMLFKMLGIERSYQLMQNETMHKPRQMFVTQSRVLAEKVKDFFLKLHESLLSADKSPEEIRAIVASRQAQQEQGLVDLDEEIDWRGDLPKRYGDLTDEHFPMFITYDQLCRLLEAELDNSPNSQSTKPFVQNIAEETNGQHGLSNDYMQQLRAAFVSYGVFLESYWPHFTQSLTKGLDPALVFAEFMGVLKGSEQTLSSDGLSLNKDQYSNLSHRTQGTFVNQRETIYKLFQAYTKRKRDHSHYDAADRTHAILKRLRDGVPGQLVDFIYIDEAQDNLLIDALVIRTICNNPDAGLFWAGDTAQTISIGSAFRFDDLKAFLYRIEVDLLISVNSHGRSRLQPRTFQLAVNYRSHAGIVNCAHSVIELITRFWPHAIDNLAPEKGIIEGLKPVFFSGWDEDTARYEQFLFGESGSQIEFGAQQCILVRDDAARERLRAQVGDIGLIMTLYESKGLEFNDVLLYNFFADSTVDLSQWRVILNALPEGRNDKYKAPTFDDTRHNGVCRDLKFLYVAITRARKNLWIADSSDKGNPMRILWTMKDQIQNCTPGSDVPQLAMSSTPEEWAKTALALFNNRRYSQAMHCYERASMPREKAVAHAYFLREQARSTSVNAQEHGSYREAAFRTAADAFYECAESAVIEKKSYFRISAECYSLSGDDGLAAAAYVRASEYTLAAQHYRKGAMFDEAVDLIRSHRDVVDTTIAESIIDVSRLEYLRERKLKQARELFETDEEALEYMDDFGLDVAQATLLEELERFADAAQLHLAEGRTLDAIKTLLRDTNTDSLQLACRYLLDGLWRGLPLGLTPRSESARANTTLTELIRMSADFNVDALDERTRDELLMFRAIIADDSATLLELGERFYRWHANGAAALRCLDHVFTGLPKLLVASALEVTSSLHQFLLYARLLQGFLSKAYSCDNEDIQRLVGFEVATEDFFLVPRETYLFSRCNHHSTPSLRPTDQGALVLRWEIERLFKQILRGRLHQKVVDENDLCRRLRSLQPCLAFVASGHCSRLATGECPLEHLPAEAYNLELYNLRVRIVLQQILIYHTIYSIEHPAELSRQRRYWLRRLHEMLNPPFYKVGSPASLRGLTIPEFNDAVHTIGSWLVDWLYSLDPYNPSGYAPNFLTSFIRVASLAFAFYPEVARLQIPRVRCVSAYRPEMLMRQHASDATYVIHDLIKFMENETQASLSRGILFTYHVLQKQVPIDVVVLCNFLDFLCGLLVMCTHFRYNTLHDVTLPKSWIIRLSGNLHKLKDRDTRLVHVYIRPMAELLKQMYTGENADHLLYESRNLSTITWRVRNMFVARICKNLCLLGYNSRLDWLRKDILAIVTSLRKHMRGSDPLLERYISARLWDHLAREVRQNSAANTSLDEMIQIHEASRTSGQLPTFPNVRHIVYNTIDEIPILLASGATSLPKAELRRDATPFPQSHEANETQVNGMMIPAVSTAPSPDDVYTAGDEDIDTEDVGAEDMKPEEEFDGADVVISAEDSQMNAVSMQPSEQELKAALTLLTVYRAYVLRRTRREQERSMKAIHALRRRVIASFHIASKDMEWPHRYYRMLFLGPIPHAVICLELLHAHLAEAKSSAKKRLNIAIHHDLEAVKAGLTEIVQLVKGSQRLKEALKPDADLHKRRDIEQLKKYVVEVRELARRMSTKDWQDDMELAYKGIVEPRQPPAKKPKPELNVDDEIDDEYM